MIAPSVSPGILQNIGLPELICIGFVVMVTFVIVGGVVALIAIRSRRRPCPHCGVSLPMSANVCTSCGKKVE